MLTLKRHTSKCTLLGAHLNILPRITIRGEHLGTGESDLAGIFVNGSDCLLISEWKTDKKILALAPAKVSISSSLSFLLSFVVLMLTLPGLKTIAE